MKKLVIRKNLPLLVTGLVALGLVSAAAYVHLHQAKPKLPDTTPGTLSSQSTTGPASHPGAGSGNTADNSATSTSPSQPTPSPPTDTKYQSQTLAIPTGQLLSNHNISLMGTDQSNSASEVSTCNTVPGATCTIQITGPNNVEKSAVDQPVATDSQGNVSISWNAKDRGLTPGKWKVVAVASKDSQTATSAPDYLTVTP